MTWIELYTTKFGLLIDTNLLERGTSANPKPEVKFQDGGRLFFQT